MHNVQKKELYLLVVYIQSGPLQPKRENNYFHLQDSGVQKIISMALIWDFSTLLVAYKEGESNLNRYLIWNLMIEHARISA